MSEWAICSECGRELKGYVPKGGDGSLLHVPYHKKRTYDIILMEARHYTIRCEGSNRPEKEYKR